MTKKTNSRGILMFAHNNEEIDYLRLAVVNSLLAQQHLCINNSQITIVTDPYSYEYAEKELGKRMLKKACKNYILVDKDPEFKRKNIRVYKDTTHKSQHLQFYNANRCDAYQLTPYDETIVIDADYLVLSDSLNKCWGSNNDLMMNWQWKDVMSERNFDNLDRVGPLGITMYWATVVYFRKSEYCETFFNFVTHVRENREYYGDLYKWPGSMYRNDYSFSIAAHMIGGYRDKAVPQLPFTLYKTFDHDDLHKVSSASELFVYLEKPRSPGDFILTRWADVDLHVMNKWAFNRVSEQFLEFLR